MIDISSIRELFLIVKEEFHMWSKNLRVFILCLAASIMVHSCSVSCQCIYIEGSATCTSSPITLGKCQYGRV